MIIALGELYCIVGFAVARGQARGGKLIVYVGDNQTVQRWIEGRKPKNRMARHLVRLLNYVEAKCHCHILAAPYIRTHSNEMAGMLTRADEAEVSRRMQEGGFELIGLAATWAEVLTQEHERRIHAVALVDPAD